MESKVSLMTMNPLMAKSISIKDFFMLTSKLLNFSISYTNTVDKDGIKPCEFSMNNSLSPSF